MNPAGTSSNGRSARRRARHVVAAWAVLSLALGLPPAPAGAADDPPSGEGASPSSAPPDESRAKEEAAKDPERGGAAKPAATPRPTPKPAPRPAARSAPAATPAPPLRFTDEDLERFRRKPPEAPEGEEDEGSEEAGAASAVAPPAAGGPAAPASKRPPAARPAPQPTPPPGVDPLMAFKERERRQAMRAEQLKSLRDRIAAVQARLDFLNAKRLALVNPLHPMPAGGGAEERKRDAALKPRELLELVEKEIADVETQLAEAQEDLVEFQTRFAGELGVP